MKRIVYTPLSREFLIKRGYCCKSGCKNCPYNYKKEELMRQERRIPYPTQEEIIAFNRRDNAKKELEDNVKVSLYDLEDMSMKPYDDGVCEGEYVRPTQAEIIEHNRKHCSDFIGLSNYTEKMTLVPENLLEKLKDFNYWKEWKNK
jgi:hypothetical protein